MSSKSNNAASPELYTGATEPCLTEIYNDPTLHAILKRDGLPLAALKDVVNDAKRNLVA